MSDLDTVLAVAAAFAAAQRSQPQSRAVDKARRRGIAVGSLLFDTIVSSNSNGAKRKGKQQLLSGKPQQGLSAKRT